MAIHMSMQPENEAPAPLPKEPQALGFIQPRNTARVRKARRPRRLVNFLRIALPATAAVVLLALVVWPVIKPNSIKTAIMKNIPDLVIDNLRFTGLDSKNEPYSMTALKATRPGGAENIFDLDQPNAEITLANGAWVSGRAQYGRYEQDSRKLWLGGDVQMFHDKGYQFTTDEAQVDLKENFAWGEKPVLIQGNFGEIRGQGFKLLDSGHVMVVTGPAHAILNLHAGSGSDKPETAKTQP